MISQPAHLPEGHPVWTQRSGVCFFAGFMGGMNAPLPKCKQKHSILCFFCIFAKEHPPTKTPEMAHFFREWHLENPSKSMDFQKAAKKT